jgi:hypothetical protein
MRKFILFAAVAGFFLLGAAQAASPTPAPFQAAFCPECWEFLWFSGSTDMKGQCALCGRYPVNLDVQIRTWFWCGTGQKWLPAPCAENRKKHCCAAVNSLAVAEAGVQGVRNAWYCPTHRSFEVTPLPVVGRMVCVECLRPAVRVQAIFRAWYWCSNEGLWADAPCPMNPVMKCCAKRGGFLLKASPDGDRISED